MRTLAERLIAALDRKNMRPADLARRLGVSPQSLYQIQGGFTKQFNSTNNARAAAILDVSALWLATGEGSMTEPKGSIAPDMDPASATYANLEPVLPHHDANAKPVTGSARAVSLARTESLRPGEMWLPQYEGVRAMMGDGSDGANDLVTLLRVSEEGLRRRLIRTSFTSLSNLKLISAYGDSMAGTVEDGDVILVDAGVSAIDRDGVYVYSRDDELLVKRLQREDDGSLTVISDNPRYRDRHIAREDRAIYRVHGRALLAWTARVL